jgi:hypothetical protein
MTIPDDQIDDQIKAEYEQHIRERVLHHRIGLLFSKYPDLVHPLLELLPVSSSEAHLDTVGIIKKGKQP